MENARYIVLQHIEGMWTPIASFDSPLEATDHMDQADEDISVAIYDQQQRELKGFRIPKRPGSGPEALLEFATLKQIEADLAGKDNPPGLFTL
jgi:hypothetical protein